MTERIKLLHVHLIETGREHTGIIVSDQLQTGVILRRLLKLLDGRNAAEMRNRLEFLSQWR